MFAVGGLPMVVAPAPSSHIHPGPSYPLDDLTPRQNQAKGKHPLKPSAASSSDKGKHAVPVDELRRAVKGMEDISKAAPSKLHDFVATDDGIVGSVIPKLPSAPQLNRTDALKIMDKQEGIEGFFCPCITYGKVKHELDKAVKSRAGEEEPEEDTFNSCNGPCCGYAAVTIILLSTKQTKDIRLFYDMGVPEGNKALNVILHGVTDLRNLAEVRIREELRKTLHLDTIEKAQKYVSHAPMEMKRMFPDRLPEVSMTDALDYALADGKTKADSLLGRFKGLLDEKALEQLGKEPEAEAPAALEPIQKLSPGVSPEAFEDTPVEEGEPMPDSLADRFKHFLGSKASDQPEPLLGQKLPATPDIPQKMNPAGPPEAKEERPGRLFPFAFGEKKANKGEPSKKPKEDQPKKPKSKSKSRGKKSQKAKGKQVDRENVPPIPEGAQPDDEADQATHDPGSALEGIPQLRLDRGQSIVEIPADARVHSISDDTFVLEKQPLRSHSLNLDDVVPFDRARLSHILEHDQVIPAQPTPEEHRLSKDAVIPKSAVTPGHLLEESDPVVSGPRQVFSHEILDDPIVERAKAFLPHGLESDKKIADVAKAARAHSLATDTVVPVAQPSPAAHDLESDKRIAAPPATGGGEHDISRDVRILSPSGAVRTTHTIEEDEIIHEGAQFRKSPRPSAADLPGNWASSSGSEEDVKTNKNLMGSLNAVIDSADRALDELGRPENKGAGGPDAPPGRGFWGRMFPKRQNTAPAAVPEARAPAPSPVGNEPATTEV